MNPLKRLLTAVAIGGAGLAAGGCALFGIPPINGAPQPGAPGPPTVEVNCPTDNLQNALDHAEPGSLIEVHGTCTGNFNIGVDDLVVVGNQSTAPTLQGAAVLDGGGGGGSVVRVNRDVTATLISLTIEHGSGSGGGGGINIPFGATVTLEASQVTDNVVQEDFGGGILNDGTLYLNGSSVTHNTDIGEDGGGIWNSGTAELRGSTVSGNTSTVSAGGIYNQGSVSLLESSVVTDNHPNNCGGVVPVAGCSG